MPLPWKKTKVARISRLVADLHSPKRGGSLVVQTGFPTSLVDLFVKNRDRLKKQSKNQKSQSQSQKQQTHSQIEISEPILNKSICTTEKSSANEVAADTHVREFVVVEEFSGAGGNGSKWNSVLLASLKMFVVLVLALSTKKLAVGVTVSAILLLLLEYVGVNEFLFCSESTTRLVSFLRIKFNKSNQNGRCLNKSELCEEVLHNGGNSSSEEIQVEEEEPRTGPCLDVEEQVRIKDVLMSSYNDTSKSSKFKQKLMKRLVPKKLRDSKKKKNKWEKNQVEMESSLGQNKLGKLIEQEQDDEKDSSIVLIKEEESDMTTEREGLACYGEVDQSQEIKQNSGYLILISIVLAGLVGGRIVALVLILAWFLMLKLIG